MREVGRGLGEHHDDPRHLRAVFEHALDAIVLFDDAGAVQEANPAAARLVGSTREALRGRAVRELVEDDAALSKARAAHWANGQGHHALTLRDAGGATRELDVRTVALEPDLNLLIAREVTEQRRAEQDARFHAQLLAGVGDAVIATDLEGTVLYWNAAAERLYGGRADERVGTSLVRSPDVPSTGAHARELLDAVRRGESRTEELVLRRRDGTTFVGLVTTGPFHDVDGGVAGLIGITTDVTRLREATDELRRRARQQEAVAEVGQRALAMRDPWELAEEAARRLSVLLGCDVSLKVGRSADGSVQACTPPGSDQVCVRSGSACALLDAPAAARLDEGDRGFLKAMAHVVDAVASREIAHVRLEHLTTHDLATGLPNRAAFADRVTEAQRSARRTGRRFAVLMLDVDAFKLVNEGYGHAVGDEVLQQVALRLRAAVGPGDVVARVGGDEFAALCVDLDGRGGLAMAERVQAALQEPLRLVEAEGVELTLTVTVGLVHGDDDSEATGLLRDADAALRWAKDEGRGGLEVFDRRMRGRARERLDLAARLRRALAEEALAVRYQPLIDLRTGALTGAEALVRLPDGEGGLIGPDQFVPVAEEAGLIGALGEQVLAAACRQARAWLGLDPRFAVAVNVSPHQLAGRGAHRALRSVVSREGLDPRALWLEITETALLGDASMVGLLRRLRADGIRLSIDDFGTGYSSLAQLRHMPVDRLKIDRAFVRGVAEDAKDRALVTAAIDLAVAFGLGTVAEGVETAEQRTALQALGCDQAQGFWWSKPVTAERLTTMVREGLPA